MVITSIMAAVMAAPDLPILEGEAEARAYFQSKDRASAIVLLNEKAYQIAKAGSHCEIKRLGRYAA
jgi:predicted transcriptional regulator